MKPSFTDIAIRAAPLTFVVLWCTGFISAKYGMPYAEPLTFLFARMGLVVLVLAAIVMVMRVPLPGAVDAWHSLVAGFLLQTLYLGGVFVALSQGVPAGISALIPGLQPILTATLAGRFLGERVTPVQWGGFALGLVGVLLVLNDRNVSMTGTPLGWTASVISLLGITLGTLYQKRYCGAIDWRSGNLVQFAGATIVFAIGCLRNRDSPDRLDHPVHIGPRLVGDRAVGPDRRADVLADPAHPGLTRGEPVLSRAGNNGRDRVADVRRNPERIRDCRHGAVRRRGVHREPQARAESQPVIKS